MEETISLLVYLSKFAIAFGAVYFVLSFTRIKFLTWYESVGITLLGIVSLFFFQ